MERVIPAFDVLLGHYEKHKRSYTADRNIFMISALETGWEKLRTYYVKTDQSPVYIAAVVLYWITEGKIKVRELWDNEYKPAILPQTDEIFATANIDESDPYYTMFHQTGPVQHTGSNEYTRYLSEPLFTSGNRLFDRPALAWWLDQAQRDRFLNLYKMAYDILSIPSMSAETERLFSQVKHILTA
ncbi:Phospholipase C [Agyrium rufum]|nr:Phospholipase C [Agyrium rufum]